jgi:hypothetical protein
MEPYTSFMPTKIFTETPCYPPNLITGLDNVITSDEAKRIAEMVKRSTRHPDLLDLCEWVLGRLTRGGVQALSSPAYRYRDPVKRRAQVAAAMRRYRARKARRGER